MISTFIKFMIPLVMHYISVIKGKKEVRNLIYYYRPLFYLTYEKEHVNLYAKLFHSIGVKANFNESKNPLIWSKYAANSIDTVSYTEELLDKNLIVDNVFKYDFYENIISFNSTILKTQLDYSCIKNFGINMREISTEKDSDGLSYLDKLEMDTIKIDENQILLSHVNIKDTIKRIKKKHMIKISKEEREFYIKNMKINQIGKELDEPVILGEPLDEETLRAKTTIYRIDGEAYKDDVEAVEVCQRIHVSRSFGAFNPVEGW